jgi:predicted DNA-binding transcriptional regulator YafY
MATSDGQRLVGGGQFAGTAQLHQAVPLVERQHALIEELRVRAPRPVPAVTLARGLGVSARTIARDVARLMTAGVPIEVRNGPGGGYLIDSRATLPPLVFSPGEAAALVASLVAVGPYSSATAQSALRKLLAAMSPEEPVVGQRRRSPSR